MSVPSNLRDLSDMEFYKNALRIRIEITKWMLRDFGEKKNLKNIKYVIKDITEEEKKPIDETFEKHGMNVNREFTSEYPEWFINDERQKVSKLIWEMMSNIIGANSIHAEHLAESDLRRCKQDVAITAVQNLYAELQFIQNLFPQNLNYFEPLLEALDKEDHLLKGWRQSDNKVRKQIENKFTEKWHSFINVFGKIGFKVAA